jgi:hypothetical protein
MRRYDDLVEVRRGRVADGPANDPMKGPGAVSTMTYLEGPEQFLWRGRLWKVAQVVAHWVETGPWWRSSGVHAVLGADEPGAAVAGPDLVAEREVWRVEADRGLGTNRGMIDLVFDWADGSWRLTRCQD